MELSTASIYNSVLNNFLTAQNSEIQAGTEVSTQKVATDLQGYGASASNLTAFQSVQTQVNSYVSQASITASKLSVQDSALGQVASAATSASTAISDALSTNSGTSLVQSLDTAYQNAVAGLNTTYNGEYIFSGGQTSTAPVSATSLSALGAAASVSSVFQNGQYSTTTQISPNTTIQTGFLASDIGTPLFTALQNIQNYNNGPNGPLTGTLNATQTAYLQTQLTAIKSAGTGITNIQAENGELQSQVTNAQTDLTNQQTSLQTLIGNITDANLAQADTNLQQAQLAVQASAQVLSTLKESSLVNLLPTG
jgi:flagellar hook-associated protein 3 FlgL